MAGGNGTPSLFEQARARQGGTPVPNTPGLPSPDAYAYGQALPAFQNAMQGTQAFRQQANTGANQIQTNFNQYVPQLQTNFQSKPGLDAFSQGLLSQAQQGINRNLGAVQGQIARGVQGPAAGVLQNQAAMQARLQGNPLLFNVAAQQVGRQQQEQQLANSALLAQQGAQNTGASASNAAVAQRVGLQGLPVAAQQNLISTLQSEYKK